MREPPGSPSLRQSLYRILLCLLGSSESDSVRSEHLDVSRLKPVHSMWHLALDAGRAAAGLAAMCHSGRSKRR